MRELIPIEVVRFCAIECRLQMSGEISVWNMVEAWRYCVEQAEWKPRPSLDDVREVGRLVEPNLNRPSGRSEFRTVDVRVGWDVKAPWEEVPRLMVSLMEAVGEGAFSPRSLGNGISTSAYSGACSFFKEYEEIHPWRDGNGRSGVLLFNWLNGTLDNLIWAPNFWDDPRRTVGYGA